LNQRREACEVKSTSARNDYLLSLAATNAHLQRYYHSDTPELMKVGYHASFVSTNDVHEIILIDIDVTINEDMIK